MKKTLALSFFSLHHIGSHVIFARENSLVEILICCGGEKVGRGVPFDEW